MRTPLDEIAAASQKTQKALLHLCTFYQTTVFLRYYHSLFIQHLTENAYNRERNVNRSFKTLPKGVANQLNKEYIIFANM